MRVLTYVISESERQSATDQERVGLLRAHSCLKAYSDVGGEITESVIKMLANLVNGTTEYRQTPVTFSDGGYSLPPRQIPHAMGVWAGHLSMYTSDSDLDPDYWIKEFLLIHPFTDGNGRVASLLWNYLKGTLADPEPLPYFFGEQPVGV